jgi:hypothetical protein
MSTPNTRNPKPLAGLAAKPAKLYGIAPDPTLETIKT